MTVSTMPETGKCLGLRLLENIVLYLLLLTTVLEHFRQTLSTSHAASKARPDFGGMHVFVELVGVGDAGHVECLSSADEGPQRRSINLGNNLVRDSVAAGMPSGGNLSSDSTTERKSFRNKDTSALLELDEPLAVVARPDIATIALYCILPLRPRQPRWARDRERAQPPG